jgi:hypothetical protein
MGVAEGVEPDSSNTKLIHLPVDLLKRPASLLVQIEPVLVSYNSELRNQPGTLKFDIPEMIGRLQQAQAALQDKALCVFAGAGGRADTHDLEHTVP